MSTDTKIRVYCAERDAILRANDLDRFTQWAADQGTTFSRREIAEIALRKMQTAIPALPEELRREAKTWLSARGYRSFDDGDVAEEGHSR